MARNPLYFGDVVHGFAGGLFGRDHYTCVQVDALGADWALLRGVSSERRNLTVTVAGAEDLAFAAEQVASPNLAHCESGDYASSCRYGQDDD